ncbi:MAG TPA: ABC transporter substrate-binding protein [Solirubrobacteraceae bacterium]|nr:ABC transporter substrate-binding protein [Solirubrobacteraceae bacterium]
MPARRALASASVACLAALAVAGCAQNSSSSSAVTVSGKTLTIYVSEPSNFASNAVAQDVVDAEKLAFSQHHGEVTDYKLEMLTRKESTISQNARDAIQDPTAIAYLGEIAPGSSDQTVGITNTLDLLQVSPTDTALELSQSTTAVTGAPQTYFESWSTYGRTFARVVPSAAGEAKAQVAEMKASGVTRLYIANDGSDYGKAIADEVSSDATAAGLTLEASVGEEVNGYFYGAESPSAAAKFFNHIASMAPTAKLFGPSSLDSTAFTSALSSSVHSLYVSIPGFMPKDVSAEGKGFVTAFKAAYHHAPNTEAIFGYEAMSAVLRVLQHAGSGANNRNTVIKDFLGQRKVPSVLGTYSIDSGGNTSLDAFVFARLRNGKLVPFAAAPTTQG